MIRISEFARLLGLYSDADTDALESAMQLTADPEIMQHARNLEITTKEAMERARDGRSIACTTKEVREIAREAHRRGLNRQLKPAHFKLLDPRGTHILSPQFMHDKADGKKVEPHLRCHGYFKLLGKAPAVERLIDVPMQFLSHTLTEEQLQEAIDKGRSFKAMDGNADKTPEDYGAERVEEYPIEQLQEDTQALKDAGLIEQEPHANRDGEKRWKTTQPEGANTNDDEGKA